MPTIASVKTFTLAEQGRMSREDFNAIHPYIAHKFGKLQRTQVPREIESTMLSNDQTSKQVRAKMVAKAEQMRGVKDYRYRKMAYDGQGKLESRRVFRDLHEQHVELFAYVLKSGVMVEVINEIVQTTGQNPMDWTNIYTTISGRVNLGTAMTSVVKALEQAEKEVSGVRQAIIKQRKDMLAFIGNVVSIGVTIGVPFPAGAIVGTLVRAALSGKDTGEIVGQVASSYFETGAKGLAKDSSGKPLLSVDGYNPIDPKWVKGGVEGAAGTLGGFIPLETYRKKAYEWVVTPSKSLRDDKVTMLSQQMRELIETAIKAVDEFHKSAFDNLKSIDGVAPIAIACYSRFRPYLLRRIVAEYNLTNSISKDRAREIFKAELIKMVRGYILRLGANTAVEMQRCRSNLQDCPLGKETANMSAQFIKVLYAMALTDPQYVVRHDHPGSRGGRQHERLYIPYRVRGLQRQYYQNMLKNHILIVNSNKAEKYNWRPESDSPVPIDSHSFGRVNPGDRAKYRIANWAIYFRTHLGRMVAGQDGLNRLVEFLDSQHLVPPSV